MNKSQYIIKNTYEYNILIVACVKYNKVKYNKFK